MKGRGSEVAQQGRGVRNDITGVDSDQLAYILDLGRGELGRGTLLEGF